MKTFLRFLSESVNINSIIDLIGKYRAEAAKLAGLPGVKESDAVVTQIDALVRGGQEGIGPQVMSLAQRATEFLQAAAGHIHGEDGEVLPQYGRLQKPLDLCLRHLNWIAGYGQGIKQGHDGLR